MRSGISKVSDDLNIILLKTQEALRPMGVSLPNLEEFVEKINIFNIKFHFRKFGSILVVLRSALLVLCNSWSLDGRGNDAAIINFPPLVQSSRAVGRALRRQDFVRLSAASGGSPHHSRRR